MLVRAFGGAAGGSDMFAAAFQALNGLWRMYGLMTGVDFKATLTAADVVGVPAHCVGRDVNETLQLLRGALGEVNLPRLLPIITVARAGRLDVQRRRHWFETLKIGPLCVDTLTPRRCPSSR